MADQHGFDELTKVLASTDSRRTWFGRIAALFGGALLGLFGLPRRGFAEPVPAGTIGAWTLGSPMILVLPDSCGKKGAENFICFGNAKFQIAGHEQYKTIACQAAPKDCVSISPTDCSRSEAGDWQLRIPKDLVY